MLPPPKDGKPLPTPSEAEFYDTSGEEDERLLETGRWDATPRERIDEMYEKVK